MHGILTCCEAPAITTGQASWPVTWGAGQEANGAHGLGKIKTAQSAAPQARFFRTYGDQL